MPIEVFTGIPGAGKTLRMLEEVEQKGRTESRQVYYNGIKDLAIDGWIEFEDAQEWYKLPKGSIIVIDEAQRVFRPSHFAKEVPPYLSELETHRHNGFDIFMTTQRIMLLHTNLRGLIGRHVHVNRRFGTHRATLLEFPRAVEQPQAKQDDAIRHEWKYPQNVFKWYKSAEVHTIKRRIPAKLYILLALPLLIGGLVWFGYSRQKARMTEPVPVSASGLPLKVAPTAGNGGNKVLTTGEWLDARKPRLADVESSAPMFDDLTKPVHIPQPSSCIASKKRCSCFTDQATPYPIGETMCREIVAKGFFNFFADEPGRSGKTAQPLAASPGLPATVPPTYAPAPLAVNVPRSDEPPGSVSKINGRYVFNGAGRESESHLLGYPVPNPSL